MKYATSSDFRRALETRLRTLSQREGVPLYSRGAAQFTRVGWRRGCCDALW